MNSKDETTQIKSKNNLEKIKSKYILNILIYKNYCNQSFLKLIYLYMKMKYNFFFSYYF